MSQETNPLEAQLIEVLKEQAAAFVKGSGEDGIELGEETVRMIFAQEVAFAALPTLPPVADSTLETIVRIQEICEQRSRAFQLLANAEKAQAERLKRVRDNAAAVAGKLAAAGSSILAAAAIKALLSK